MINAGRTVKITIEGELDLVEAVSERIKQFFTVTYISGDRPVPLSKNDIRRYLRLVPPNLVHNSDHEEVSS